MLQFRVGGVPVSVSFWFFALLALFALARDHVLLPYLLLPVLAHELGHLLVMAVLRVRVLGVTFSASGIAIRRSVDCTLSYRRECLICLAGPAVNLVLAGWLHLAGFPTTRTMLLAAANLAVALFNLLPIGDLDGGQILKLLAASRLSDTAARRISRIASVTVLGGLIGFVLFLAMSGQWSPSLLAVCVYLAGNLLRQE